MTGQPAVFAVARWALRWLLFRTGDLALYLVERADDRTAKELDALAHRSYDWAHRLVELPFEVRHAR